uniref:Uncharacterized protein n=1 Tax=Kalanchoe fedtschenkoi TaxID=63787 RepID=A0A7N0VD85_KALFE
MSSFNSGGSVDHLFLQTLINRLQIRQPNPRSLDDLLFDAISNLSCSDDDDDDQNQDTAGSHKSRLSKEESRLEKQLIRLIRAGDTQTLKPNSGQAVTVGEHHICVGNHVEDGSDYRVWEWHGHIMMFDEENGYTPEYIYGNYFERLPALPKGMKKKKKEEEEEQEVEPVKEDEQKPVNLGLKELIDGGETGGGRVVHRGLNPAR